MFVWGAINRRPYGGKLGKFNCYKMRLNGKKEGGKKSVLSRGELM
jgi:hypothetical protein